MPPKKKARTTTQKKRKLNADDDDDQSISDNESSAYEEKEDAASEIEDEEEEDALASESDFNYEESIKPKRKKSASTPKRTPAKPKKVKTPKSTTPKTASSSKSRYVKKEKTLGGVMSRLKYINTRKVWISEPSYQETEEYYLNHPISMDNHDKLISKVEQLLSNLQHSSSIITLDIWLQEHEIILDSFQMVQVYDNNNPQSSIQLDPFHGRCPTSDAVTLEQLEFYFNLTSPIRYTLFAPYPSLLHFTNSQIILNFHIAVGLTRVGWPVRHNDYERKHKTPLISSLLSNPFASSGDEDITVTDEHEKTYGIGNDYWRCIEEYEEHDNLLPIYSITHKIMKTKLSTSTQSHEISYFISLNNRGSVVSMAWNPIIKPNNLMIGLLAIVGGDGNCIIVLAPNESQIPKLASNNNTSSSPSSESSYLDKPVINERDVSIALIHKTNAVHVTSVSWHPSHVYRICCGMSQGSIIIYDIESTIQEGTPPKIIMRFRDPCANVDNAALSSLTSVKICPYEPSLILSAGYDGDVKLWQKGKAQPISTTSNPDAVIDADWDPHGCGLYYSCIDSTWVNWEGLWSFPSVLRTRSLLYQHQYRVGAVWKTIPFSYHNQTVICSVASDGTIRGGFSSCLALNKEPQLSFFEYFRMVSVVHPKSNAPNTISGSETAAGCRSSSNNKDEDDAEMVVDSRSTQLPTITIDTSITVEPNATIVDDVPIDNTVALHSIDHMVIEDENYAERFHFLVFGGAAGLMVIKCFQYPSIPDNDEDE